MTNDHPGYHEGMTDAQIKTLFESVDRIDKKLDELYASILDLKTTRARLIGLVIGISSTVSMVWGIILWIVRIRMGP